MDEIEVLSKKEREYIENAVQNKEMVLITRKEFR